MPLSDVAIDVIATLSPQPRDKSRCRRSTLVGSRDHMFAIVSLWQLNQYTHFATSCQLRHLVHYIMG